MPHHNTTKTRALKRAQHKGRLIPDTQAVAAWIERRPAETALPLAPPSPATVPDEPPAHYGHGIPPWPLNEDDIDLPTEPSPADPAPAPTGLHYLGAVRGHFAGIPGDCDLEVMALPPGHVILGPLYLELDQGLRLTRLLLAALSALTRKETLQ